MILKKLVIIITIFFLLVAAVIAFQSLSDSKEKTYSFETKAFNLSPNDKEGISDFKTDFPTPGDGWIKAITFEVIGAPKTVLHHVVLSYSGNKDLTCPDFPQRIHSTAHEMTPLVLPPPYGYPIIDGAKFSTFTHLYNPNNTKYADVKVKVNILFQKKGLLFTLNRPKAVVPVWLDAVNCSLDPTFLVGPEQSAVFHASPKISIPRNSRIVYAFGHFHQWGQWLNLEIDGEKSLSFYPQLKGGEIDTIKPAILDKNKQIQLTQGQTLDISTYYNNPTDQTVDGMGISLLYLAKD